MIRAILAAASLATSSGAAVAQDRPAAPPAAHDAQPSDVVVTGVRLKDSAAALRDCLARRCPPKEDIAATLAHAENEFVAGDYHAARQALTASVGRNRRYGKQYPIEVSDLLRANSRIAASLGEGGDFLFSAIEVVRILKAGLPPDDYRVLGARIEQADAYAKSRQVETALNIYDDVIARAHKLNLPWVEGFARLRQAGMLWALTDAGVTQYTADMNRALDSLIAEKDPRLAPYALGARLLKARFAAKHGDATAIDRMMADYRRLAGASNRPVLLYSPAIAQNPAHAMRLEGGGENLSQMPVDNFDNQWVDISFWIAPDGHVTDAGVLRQSDKLSGYWVKPIVTSIAGRRYAPLAMDRNDPGLLRVERYTFTARWTTDVTGTHLRQREPVPQIEMVDLTADAPAAAPAATSPAPAK